MVARDVKNMIKWKEDSWELVRMVKKQMGSDTWNWKIQCSYYWERITQMEYEVLFLKLLGHES